MRDKGGADEELGKLRSYGMLDINDWKRYICGLRPCHVFEKAQKARSMIES